MVYKVKSKHVYLNIFQIDFPITALASILHRLTGLFLFLSLPFVLYFFYLTVESSSSFIIANTFRSDIYCKLFFYFFTISFIYHSFNGLKHIIMDLGYFDTKTSSRNFTIIVLLITLFFIFLSILV